MKLERLRQVRCSRLGNPPESRLKNNHRWTQRGRAAGKKEINHGWARMGTDKDVSCIGENALGSRRVGFRRIHRRSHSLAYDFDLIPKGRPMNTINVKLRGIGLSIRAHPCPSVVKESSRLAKKSHGSGTDKTGSGSVSICVHLWFRSFPQQNRTLLLGKPLSEPALAKLRWGARHATS